MNTRIEESSGALKSRSQRPMAISELELEALKVAIAEMEGYEKAESGEYIKTTEEWVGMEELIALCNIAVFHHYKADAWADEGTVIFLLSPFREDNFQVWFSTQDNLKDLHLVDQATDMQNA
jgi:hypothetical protein